MCGRPFSVVAAGWGRPVAHGGSAGPSDSPLSQLSWTLDVADGAAWTAGGPPECPTTGVSSGCPAVPEPSPRCPPAVAGGVADGAAWTTGESPECPTTGVSSGCPAVPEPSPRCPPAVAGGVADGAAWTTGESPECPTTGVSSGCPAVPEPSPVAGGVADGAAWTTGESPECPTTGVSSGCPAVPEPSPRCPPAVAGGVADGAAWTTGESPECPTAGVSSGCPAVPEPSPRCPPAVAGGVADGAALNAGEPPECPTAGVSSGCPAVPEPSPVAGGVADGAAWTAGEPPECPTAGVSPGCPAVPEPSPRCPPAVAGGVADGASWTAGGSSECRSAGRSPECPVGPGPASGGPPAVAGGVADCASGVWTGGEFPGCRALSEPSSVCPSAAADGLADKLRSTSLSKAASKVGTSGSTFTRLYGGIPTLKTKGACINRSVRPKRASEMSGATSAGVLRMSPSGMNGAAICAAITSGRFAGPRVFETRIAGDRGPEVFVSGGVGERKVEWLLDTGAQCTVIDASVVEGLELPRIPAPQRPVAVEGTPLDLNCVVMCDLCVGSRTLRDHPVYVMNDLKPYCILGTDVFKRLGSSIWIDFESNSVHVRRCAISDDSSAVTLSASVSIPPKHEAVVMCRVPSVCSGEIVVEHADRLSEEYSVVSARTVAEITESHLIPVKLMNPTNRTVGIPARATVARIVEEPLLEVPGPVPPVARHSSSWADELVDASDIEDASQRKAMGNLLGRYSDTFSTDGKLGKCDIVKHTIPLKADARPICQPPRRLGMRVASPHFKRLRIFCAGPQFLLFQTLDNHLSSLQMPVTLGWAQFSVRGHMMGPKDRWHMPVDV